MKSLPLRWAPVVAVLLFSLRLTADEPAAILLWPGGAPGSEGRTESESTRITPQGEHVVTGVHRPSLTPFLPSADKATGAAVVVIPGGGHRELWMDHEGYNVARQLSEHGIAGFVLKYRLARETNSTYKVDVHALADTQRAIQLVRSRAEAWRIHPTRIGVMGFSAGGELAALASIRFLAGESKASDPVDRQDSKPGFQALIYPGNSRSIAPGTNSPPAFLACAYDDRPDIAEGLANVYLRFKQAGVRTELHIWSSGGHGFGLRDRNQRPVGQWLMRFEEWLGDGGFLKRP